MIAISSPFPKTIILYKITKKRDQLKDSFFLHKLLRYAKARRRVLIVMCKILTDRN